MSLALRTVDAPAPLHFAFARELTPAEARLAGTVNLGSAPSPIKRLSARHHALARALSEGMKPGIAAATYGYELSRVSILQSDPSFRELVEHYRKEIKHDGAQMRERLLALGVDALDELNERLTDPDRVALIKESELRKIVELAADRTGFGKKTETDVNLHVGFADKLNAARLRVEELANRRKMIDVTPEVVSGG